MRMYSGRSEVMDMGMDMGKGLECVSRERIINDCKVRSLSGAGERMIKY